MLTFAQLREFSYGVFRYQWMLVKERNIRTLVLLTSLIGCKIAFSKVLLVLLPLIFHLFSQTLLQDAKIRRFTTLSLKPAFQAAYAGFCKLETIFSTLPFRSRFCLSLVYDSGNTTSYCMNQRIVD